MVVFGERFVWKAGVSVGSPGTSCCQERRCGRGWGLSWIGVIDAILDNRRQWTANHRHTAKRILDGLGEEHRLTSHTIVNI